MPDASNLQTSFSGGEWAPFMQGRADNPKYSTAMNVCLNAIPLEEGACTRRPGSAFAATTRNGTPGRLLTFDFSAVAPYEMEFTDGHLRFFSGLSLVLQPQVFGVSDISPDSPAVVTISGPSGWATGDEVQFIFNSVGEESDAAILRHRQFTITLTAAGADGSQFTLTDPVSGAALNNPGWEPDDLLQIGKVTDLATPYFNKAWNTNIMNGVQAQTQMFLLNNTVAPEVVTATPNQNSPQFGTFSISPAIFTDGPYLDPVVGALYTPSALSGVITVTLGFQTYSAGTTYGIGDVVTASGLDYRSLIAGNMGNTPVSSPADWAPINSGGAVGTNGFLSTDVGRLMRFYNAPQSWASGTSYTIGNNVTYNGGTYTALTASTGVTPDSDLTKWEINTAAALWTWGIIQSVVAANQVTVQIRGPALLYTLLDINSIFQMGAFSNTTGWPTCGCYHQGRLWLSGAIPNRIDASNSDQVFNFSPTAQDGTVGDANAITAIFNAKDTNDIYWMEPLSQGIICGTAGGEWQVSASNLNDPLTPTSIQAHRVSKYRCANVQPRVTGLATVFVQREGRKCMELLADVYSGKYSAPNLQLTGKHLTQSGIAELAYQEELSPVVWARMNNGSLIGCTYRRTSNFTTEEPSLSGWHRHTLGSGRLVESISAGPALGGAKENLWMVTNDPATGVRHVELLTDIFDQGSAITQAWFVDDAVTPSGMVVNAGKTGVTLYGLWHLNGKTVSAFIGGLDCGDHLVTNGSMFVTFGSDPGGLLTLAYLNSLISSGANYGIFATPLDQIVTVVPPRNPQNGFIQSYIGPNTTLTGYDTVRAAVDWVNGFFYEMVITTPATGTIGIRKFSIASGAQVAAATVNLTIASNVAYPNLSPYLVGFGSDGNLWLAGIQSNNDCIFKINPTTLTQVGFFGVPSSSEGYTAITMLAADQLVCVNAGGTNYVVAPSSVAIGSIEPGVTVLNADTMTWTGFSARLNGGATRTLQVVAGPNSPNSATVYGISGPGSGSNNVGTSLILWELGITAPVAPSITPSISLEKIATVPISAIDPLWADMGENLNQGYGPVYDQADGNIIITVGTAHPGASANSNYIIKLNAGTGAVMWKIPLPQTWYLHNLSRVNGWLALSGLGELATYPVYTIDTILGTATLYASATSFGVSTNEQFFDSVTGVMISSGSWAGPAIGNTYPLAPVGQTPAGGFGFGAWFRWAPGTLFQGNTTSVQRGSIPAVVGFTYSTQGQVLRVLSPEKAGAANGPALAKTRRNHMFGAILKDAQGISFGTNLSGTMHKAQLKSGGGSGVTPLTNLQLFSGVYWDTLDDTYSFDSMPAWQITRPYPATVCAIGGFLNTQDR